MKVAKKRNPRKQRPSKKKPRKKPRRKNRRRRRKSNRPGYQPRLIGEESRHLLALIFLFLSIFCGVSSFFEKEVVWKIVTFVSVFCYISLKAGEVRTWGDLGRNILTILNAKKAGLAWIVGGISMLLAGWALDEVLFRGKGELLPYFTVTSSIGYYCALLLINWQEGKPIRMKLVVLSVIYVCFVIIFDVGLPFAVAYGGIGLASYARKWSQWVNGLFLLAFVLQVRTDPFLGIALALVCLMVNEWPDERKKGFFLEYARRILGGCIILVSLLLPVLTAGNKELLGIPANGWDVIGVLLLIPGVAMMWRPFLLSWGFPHYYLYSVLWSDGTEASTLKVSLLAVCSALLILLGIGRTKSGGSIFKKLLHIATDPENKFILLLGIYVILGDFGLELKRSMLHNGHISWPDLHHFHTPHFHFGWEMAFPIMGIVAAAQLIQGTLQSSINGFEQGIIICGINKRSFRVRFFALWMSKTVVLAVVMVGGEAVAASLTCLHVTSRIKNTNLFGIEAGVWNALGLSVSAGMLWYAAPPAAVTEPFLADQMGWGVTTLMSDSGIFCLGVKLIVAYVVSWMLKPAEPVVIQWPARTGKRLKTMRAYGWFLGGACLRQFPKAVQLTLFVGLIVSHVFLKNLDEMCAPYYGVQHFATVLIWTMDGLLALRLAAPEGIQIVRELLGKAEHPHFATEHETEAFHLARELKFLPIILFFLLVSFHLVGEKSEALVNMIGVILPFSDMSMFWAITIMCIIVFIVSALADNAVATLCFVQIAVKLTTALALKDVSPTADFVSTIETFEVQFAYLKANVLAATIIVSALTAGFATRGANPAGNKPVALTLRIEPMVWIRQALRMWYWPLVCYAWCLFLAYCFKPWQLGLSPVEVFNFDVSMVAIKWHMAVGFIAAGIGCAALVYVVKNAKRYVLEAERAATAVVPA